MTRLNVYGNPVLSASDNYYNLPSHTGAVQWNGVTKNFEVSIGSGWVPIEHQLSLNTDPKFLEMLTWVRDKMKEEHELALLAKSDPTVNNLLDQIKEKQDQLKMVLLIKNKNT